MKSERLYLFVFILMLLIYTVFETLRPKPIDWTETFSNKDKIPYGTYVLYDYLNDIFPKQQITTLRKPPYNVIMGLYAYNANISNRYNAVFINADFTIDTLDLRKTLDFVDAGNNVFIAAEQIYPDTLMKILGIKMETTAPNVLNDSGVFNFTNSSLKANSNYVIHNFSNKNYFSINKNSKAEILGRLKSGQADFVRVSYGAGSFYFNAHPLIFTNYYVLNDSTKDYAYKALSYLPVKQVLWDEYQKQGLEGDQSIFQVLINNTALRWAYYVALISLCVFIVFEGKRKQRIIPVIAPLRNTTLDFTKTLGNLYLKKSNHKNIALKKISYYFEFIRERLFIQTGEINNELVLAIATKSGMEKEKIDDIFKEINFINGSTTIEQTDLLRLNNKIEEFYERVG